MNKKILISLSVIGIVAAIAIGATTAYFSDTETSEGNTLTAGVIDIVVNDENPWIESYSAELSDMKPCQTRYIEFTVRNLVYSNPIDLWKHIDIISQEDGTVSEPECDEGNGTWDQGNQTCIGNYVERNNLAAYIIYDMWVCYDPIDNERCITDPDTGEPSYGCNWIPIIEENQHVRLDNVSSAWIYLGQLHPEKELKVVQSYHLRSWPGASEPEVTNWAQGDILTFNIDLMATQLEAPGPLGDTGILTMRQKDGETWVEYGAVGTLTYNTSGSTFDYDFVASGLAVSTNYSLIYYADPWPGNNPGALIATYLTDDSAGAINALNQSVELNIDLPSAPDSNAPAGAKVWLVPSTDYNAGAKSLTAWNPSNYLFEMNLITYDDIDTP